MVQEMLAGRIQFGGDQLSSSLGHVRGGKLKPMAVANPTRSPALPDVPTVRELGFPDLEYRGFNGFFAPKGTPEPSSPGCSRRSPTPPNSPTSSSA